MGNALDEFYIDGIQHNISFLSAIMNHPRWQSGTISTGFIAEEFDGGFKGVPIAESEKFVLAACLLDHIENRRKRQISGQMNGREVNFATMREVKLGDSWHKTEVTAETDSLADECGWEPGRHIIKVAGLTLQVRKLTNGYRLSHRGSTIDAHVYTKREAELAQLMPVKKRTDTSKRLLCPMPGLVISLDVVEGQEVKVGDALAIIEAMKMQNVLRAERDVVVKKINSRIGDSLSVDQVIMEFA